MKKIFLFLIAVLMVVVSASGIAACSNGAGKTPPENSQETPGFPDNSGGETPDISDDKSVLVVYFSWSSSGRTEQIANRIGNHTGIPVFSIGFDERRTVQ